VFDMMVVTRASDGKSRVERLVARVGMHGVLLLAAFCSVLLVSVPAEADAFQMEFLTKVAAGKNPAVTLVALSDASKAGMRLTRNDGKKYFFAIGTIRAGAKQKIELDGAPGRHTYEGSVTAQVDGTEDTTPLKFTTVVALPLKIELDKADVDLERRRIKLKLSRVAGHVKLRVLGTGGKVLTEEDQAFSGQAAGTPLVLKWGSLGKAEVVRIEVIAYDSDGFYSGVAIVPWSVRIPHEQVNFATDSAIIRDSEVPKLEASYTKITDALRRYREIRGVKLFIAGHTDTVGTARYNLNLSRRRAQAIATWFRQRGVRLPVFSEGFGESALLVKTADNVDEPRNRRVDYILAVEHPNIKAKGHRAAWKRLK
jgi:outer membrane protein OmpA-like peptidoglycan-associated protein